ncbi:YqhG/Tai3 family protein [Solidesulfovibrio sp.]
MLTYPLRCRWARLLTMALWLLAGSAAATAAAQATGPGNWHRAAMEAERTLDRVLRLSEKDRNFLEFLLGTPQYQARPGKDYGRNVTARLRGSMAALERAAVTENCQGRYIDGELCGLDYNPLTCAQDEGQGAYRYKTESSGDDRAVIAYTWPGMQGMVASFRLVQEGGVWKIDAVTCRP